MPNSVALDRNIPLLLALVVVFDILGRGR